MQSVRSNAFSALFCRQQGEWVNRHERYPYPGARLCGARTSFPVNARAARFKQLIPLQSRHIFAPSKMSKAPQDAVSPQLQQFILEQQQMAQVQQLIASLTDKCWDKCIGTPGASLSSRESTCLTNCAARFMDTTQYIMQRAQHKSGSDSGY